MKDHLSKAEIRKDAVQSTVEAAAGTVGQVATIVTSAVKDVAGAVGGFATEVFEIRDSVRRASAEHAPDAVRDAAGGDGQDGGARLEEDAQDGGARLGEDAAAPGPRSTGEAVAGD